MMNPGLVSWWGFLLSAKGFLFFWAGWFLIISQIRIRRTIGVHPQSILPHEWGPWWCSYESSVVRRACRWPTHRSDRAWQVSAPCHSWLLVASLKTGSSKIHSLCLSEVLSRSRLWADYSTAYFETGGVRLSFRIVGPGSGYSLRLQLISIPHFVNDDSPSRA